MTNKETVERNLGLTFDFVNNIIDNPSLIEKLPAQFKLEFVEKDFPKLVRKKAIPNQSGRPNKLVRVRNTFEFSK